MESHSLLQLRHRFAAAFLLAAALGASAVPAAVAQPEPTFAWPTSGRVTQPYGCTGFRFEPRRGSCAHFHGGIDIANRSGTPIRAAADGVISHVGWDPWLARRIASWMVIINHGGGVQTMYAHLLVREIEGVARGQRVTKGQLIGLMGSTGLSTGPHLHFSFLRNGSWADPGDFVAGRPQPRKPRAAPQPARTGCRVTGAGMGAWLGGATAVHLEFNEPVTCAT